MQRNVTETRVSVFSPLYFFSFVCIYEAEQEQNTNKQTTTTKVTANNVTDVTVWFLPTFLARCLS